MSDQRPCGDGEMSDDQGQENARLISEGILAAAKRAKQRAIQALADGLISQAEFVEGVKAMEEQTEARAKWWLTGEGPCP
jgi:hypothetical protein